MLYWQLQQMEQFPYGPCTLKSRYWLARLMSLNFVTPINKIYPSPLSNVFLVLNEGGDLSLYRNNEHIWSAGRFKTLQTIQWSPDGI
jgi:hypothetical protein